MPDALIPMCLRSMKGNKRSSGCQRRGKIVNRRPINERSAYAELRRTVIHWECDTVIRAKHKQAILPRSNERADWLGWSRAVIRHQSK